MWLINTTTFEREFRQQESSRHGPGHDQSARYLSACQVQRHPIPYVWVDICCIDKTSSAELSEAINSMFRWYEMDKESQTFTRALGTVLGVKSSPGRPGESGSATQVLCRHTAEGGSAGEGVRESIAKWDSWPAEYAAAQLQELYSPDSIPNGHFSGVFILPEINYPLLYVVRIAPDMRSLSAKFAIETNLEVPAVYGRISMSRQRGLDKT
ncbi:hypothetical protein ACKVV1_010394 [Pyricularia oryzae]